MQLEVGEEDFRWKTVRQLQRQMIEAAHALHDQLPLLGKGGVSPHLLEKLRQYGYEGEELACELMTEARRLESCSTKSSAV